MRPLFLLVFAAMTVLTTGWMLLVLDGVLSTGGTLFSATDGSSLRVVGHGVQIESGSVQVYGTPVPLVVTLMAWSVIQSAFLVLVAGRALLRKRPVPSSAAATR